MINRILIRLKVVQLLYSYLLLEKQFFIESQPSQPTKEKRFAYSVYLDTLALFVKIAQGIEKRGGSYPLLENRFVRNLLSDEQIKSQIARFNVGASHFQEILPSIIAAVKDSGLYKNYLKDSGKSSAATDARFWENLYRTVIYPHPAYAAACEEFENYSMRGFERSREIMTATFSNYLSSQGNIPDALKTLEESLFKARELYFRLLALPIALTDLRARQIDDNRHKFLKTDEDINPNMRFVENQLVEVLRVNPDIENFLADHKICWDDDRIMLQSVLNQIMDSELYRDYMDFPVTDFHTDCEFWRDAYKQIIFRNELFLETLEEKSVFWNDDLDIIGTFMLKTLKRFENGHRDDAVTARPDEDPEEYASGENPVFRMYKDEEDSRFGKELFTCVASNVERYREYIDEAVDKTSWDTERLAFMDSVICLTAIGEMINFPKIPLRVSLNEYIQIAKDYSTAKSGSFVNGLLAKIIEMLRERKIITKTE